MREPVAVVRTATADDEVAIRGLLDGRAEGPRGTADLADLVEHAGGSWLVAEVDGAIVGTARIDLDRHPRPAVLCVAVARAARGLGIGSALVDEFRRQVRAAGGTTIDAFALPGDRETKNLFERAGLTARLIVATGEA